MPDLKSELSKVIQSWDKPTTMTQPHQSITTNSTRRVFNFVRDNPGLKRKTILERLTAVGVPETSVRSLLSSFVLRGNCRESNGLLYAAQAEYSPLKRPSNKPKKSRATTAANALQVTMLEAEMAPAPKTYATPAEWTVDSVIGNLNVRQAMAVYSELRGIFGG